MKKAGLLIAGIGFSLMITAQTTQRTPLFEIFTSSTCGPCKPGNEHFHDLIDLNGNDDKITYVKYQVSWPGNGDPYFHDDVQDRRSYYGISAVPDLILDGTNDPFISDLTQGHIDNAVSNPAIVQLDAYYQINEATQTVDIQIDVAAVDDLPSGIYLRVAIFEYDTYNNVETNGETEFFQVMKKMIPSASGTYIGSGWTAGTTDHYDLSYTFNGSYILPPNATAPVDHATNHTVEEFGDLGVVVFLQRASNKEVYQSTYAKLGYAGLEPQTVSVQSARIYPNPASETATLAFQMTGTSDVSITVMDCAGKVVHTETLQQISAERTTVTLDTQNYSEGLYLVRIVTDNGELTEKLTIQR